MNLTDPTFPGTGQCVHKDPCPEGQKVCNSKCYPLRTADGVLTCLRSPQSSHPKNDGTPKYSPDACVGQGSASLDDWTNFLKYVCVSDVNCDMIKNAGAAFFPTPGFWLGFNVNQEVSETIFSHGTWGCHQYYLTSGQCAYPCQKAQWPGAGPVPPTPPTPAPTPAPTPKPGPPGPAPKCHHECYPAADAKGYACQTVPAATDDQMGSAVSYACGDGGVDCTAISPGGICYNASASAKDQDLRLFANYVIEKFYLAHCGSEPCGKDPVSCNFGGAAYLVPAPVKAPC